MYDFAATATSSLVALMPSKRYALPPMQVFCYIELTSSQILPESEFAGF